MKNKTLFRSRFSLGASVAVILLTVVAVSLQSPVLAQDKAKTSGHSDKKISMECPMMTGLEGIKLTTDSPPLLMARADELQLTDEQKQKLKAIAQQAQRQAAEVLTPEQRSMLGESDGKAMSMMEIAMMRSQKMHEGGSDMMCPMCKKKMKEKMMQEKMEPSRSSDTQ